MTQGNREQSLFLTLDGMRGVGAMLVVVGHSLVFWGGLQGHAPPIPFCVDLFFMLSGYVISFAYEPRLASGMGAVNFLRQRFVRLYPLYALGVMMGFAVQFAAGFGESDRMGAAGLALAPQALMLPSPDFNGSGDLYPLNMPSWTLLFELWANVVYVLAWRWLTTRVLVVVVALSAVVLAVCTVSYGTLDQGPSWWNFWGGFARAMFGFFAGVLIFRAMKSPSATPKRVSWLAVPAVISVPLLCFIPQTVQTRPFVELGIVCLLGPLLVSWGQAIQPPRALAKAFGWLGAISYALYVLHYPIFEVMKRIGFRWPQLYEEYAPWTGLGILVASVAAAALAERYYDRPARRLLNTAFRSLGFGRKRQRAAVHAE